MLHKILILDDNRMQQEYLKSIVSNQLGYDAIIAKNGEEAIKLLSSPKGADIDLLLLDLMMPVIDGVEVLETIKPIRPDLVVIVITASDDINLAVKTLSLGADDYIMKQEDSDRIITSIENVLKRLRLSREVSRLERSIGGQVSFSDIIGSSSRAMQEALIVSQKAADSEITVMIKGESGVGKEMFAQAIHGGSKRMGKPFVAVNCSAIPETLIESTLFGHEKGAFTGAVQKSLGKFREANGGTLFLDEIGELKPDVQAKILRALQEGEIEPVGSSSPVKVDVRVISATHRDLSEQVEKGKFREDLLYRINAFPLVVPPLRDRNEQDIDELTDHFIKKNSAKENKLIHGISEEARDIVRKAKWSGNVRQLENEIFRAVVLCDGDILKPENFTNIYEDNSSNQTSISSNDNVISLLDKHNNDFKTLEKIEGEAILAALEHYNWKISEVARKLKIGRSTLYRKMEDLGIEHNKSKKEDVA